MTQHAAGLARSSSARPGEAWRFSSPLLALTSANSHLRPSSTFSARRASLHSACTVRCGDRRQPRTSRSCRAAPEAPSRSDQAATLRPVAAPAVRPSLSSIRLPSARDRNGVRLSEYAEWAGIRARAAFPRERRSNPSRPVVSGGVGYPVAVELEQIVGCCH